ncbi:precorrin-3B synthase [Trinickia fusca]|uniref:precorrin-3B synthase n=1 Tax=Trinickia fusca TaxID=2419777 RepID=UPI001FEC6208|nr:precorrin-3B synthase [Trinickia fusca]
MSHASPFPLRPSACPALSRIVAAHDGGLCRVKLSGGALRAEQALAVADVVDKHASGIVELTNRANLQLRGVRAGEETALVDALLRAGLGPRLADRSYDAATASSECSEHAEHTARLAAADDVRNLMVSPSAGRDVHALHDTTELAAQLLVLLQSEPRFAALSPKFALLVDGGERLMELDHAHDIWLSAMDTADAADDMPWFAFGLAGSPSTHAARALAAVTSAQVPALVCALLDTFLALARPEDTRMRNLLARHSTETVLREVSTRLDFALRRDAPVRTWRRTQADATLRFGAHRQRHPGLWYVGGQPALGRLDATTLRALAELAREHGNATLHMTPWQSVLLPDVVEARVPAVLAGLRALGIVLEHEHPLARLIACAGATGCVKSHADTKADAWHLASRLPADVHVHLSGCVRSCAASHCAPYTLLAVDTGRYDLYRREDSNEDGASDTIRATNEINNEATNKRDTGAAAERRFGRRIALRVTLDEAADLLGVLDRSQPDA